MTYNAKEHMRKMRAERAIAAGRIPGQIGKPKRLRCNAGHVLKDNMTPWSECKTCYEIAHPNIFGRGRPLGSTKTTEEQREQMKELKAQGVLQTQIAQQFGISKSGVSRIINEH